jgi:putative ABC transport system permease protein
MKSDDRRRRFVREWLRQLSRLAPRWRRDDWLCEWSAEIDASGAARPLSLLLGAAAHVGWLWSHEWSLDLIGADVTYAIRTLLARPAFAVVVIATLALGLGATTAMFTVVDAVMLRSLPFSRADRLVAIWPRVTLSPSRLEDAQGPRESLDAIGAYSAWGFTLTGGAHAESVHGARVTPQLLAVLGVPPLAGQWFPPEAVHPGQAPVALIGEGLWRRRFGGDPGAVGGRLAIEGVEHRVIGIMPASFEFPSRRSEIWVPITIDPGSGDYRANFATLVGRLHDGVSAATAQDHLRVYAYQLQRESPAQFGAGFLERTLVIPLQTQMVRDLRKPLGLLLAAVGVLLIIACANAAHLLLARAANRDAEIAVRAALGATRLRIIRQLLVESAILAGISGAAGMLLAYIIVAVLVPMVPELPQISRAVVADARVAAFAALFAAGSAMLFGIAPALHASGPHMQEALASGRARGRSSRRAWLGHALVWGEVSLATMLVVSAALLARSFVQLSRVDLGFRPDSILTLHASAPEFLYRGDDAVRTVFDNVVHQIQAIPGVQGVGAIQLLPLTADNWNPGVAVEGVPAAQQYPLDVNWRTVTQDYFRVMNIPARGGRSFTGADDQHAVQVAIVNDAFVRAVFHGQNPLGRRIRTGFEGKNQWVTVVGIVGDVRQHAIAQPALPEMYRPFAQHPLDSMRLMVRVTGDPIAFAPAVRAATARVDRDIAVDDLEPLGAVVDHALQGTRLPLLLAAMLSVLAMALGVTGVGAILFFDVTDRLPEIGVRLALGAPRAHIRRLFLARGMRLGFAGVATGAIGALAVAGLLRSLLFGVSPTDPATIAVVTAALLLVIAPASYIPASRAARTDPVKVLRAH